MNKIAFFGIMMYSSFLFSQEIINENFNSLPVGNLGTDITGVIPSNGFITTSYNGATPTTGTNAGNSNFQIVAYDSNRLNVLQLEGTNGDKGSRNIWWNDFPSLWSFRDSGKNIIEVEFDLFTGTAGGTSENTKAFYVFDETYTKVLSGFLFNTKTLALSGVSYFAPGAPIPSANYIFFLGQEQDLILPENTWVRLGFSFNKDTAKIRWKGPGFNKEDSGSSPMIGINPERLLIASRSGSIAATPTLPAIVNSASAIALFDNVVVKASNEDTLLSISENKSKYLSLSLYPIPCDNILNISCLFPMSKVEIHSIDGKKIIEEFANSNSHSIDVSKLSEGNYLVNVFGKNNIKTSQIFTK
jgi:Secretion system C-terminal sorting domain